MERTIVWEAKDGYARHRIPGMTVSSRGTLLLCHEARRAAGDWSSMDLLLSRSEDGGEHFSEPLVLMYGARDEQDDSFDLQNPLRSRFRTVNNPVMAESADGAIHLLFCEDYAVGGGRVLHRVSRDDGKSFGPPEDITAATAPQSRGAFALGPGHGIGTRSGDLLFPVWMVPAEAESPLRAHAPSVISTLFSRDGGRTFSLGEILPMCGAGYFSPNETALAELPDGRIYLNCRLGGGYTYRGSAVSPTGCGGWSAIRPERALPDPGCFGSALSYSSPRVPNALLFANCASKTERREVTLRASFDGGRTFPISLPIDRDRGGYVELGADPARGVVYVLYEEAGGERCHLVRVREDELFGL